MSDTSVDNNVPVEGEASELSYSTESAPATQQATRMPGEKPAIIGLYGIPGSGKTYLMTKLKETLKDDFNFFEGSAVINYLVEGGIEKFQKLDDSEKEKWRKAAIEWIRDQTIESRKPTIVAGHFMFWTEGGQPDTVYTEADLKTYTHILYLDVNAEVVAQQRADDKTRGRPNFSVEHLRKWQDNEML